MKNKVDDRGHDYGNDVGIADRKQQHTGENNKTIAVKGLFPFNGLSLGEEIEEQLGTTGKSGGCTRLNLAGVTMFICRRNTKLTIPFRRWKAFGKLVQLRRKLQMLETTKIPYYETMVNSH